MNMKDILKITHIVSRFLVELVVFVKTRNAI